MADEVDIANDLQQQILEATIRATRQDLPPGRPGECDLCGEHSGRLVGGACAPCRERYNLP